MPVRQILCLANSIKYHGFCFAGIDLQTRDWIRPLGSGSHGAVTSAEQTLSDGSRPSLLDIVQISLDEAVPTPSQPENWSTTGEQWTKVGTLPLDEVREILDSVLIEGPLFGTSEKSLAVEDIPSSGLQSSLALIHPTEVYMRRVDWPEGAKAEVTYPDGPGFPIVKITDPVWRERVLTGRRTLSFEGDDAPYLTISLAEEYKGRHYKLVAGVIELPAH